MARPAPRLEASGKPERYRFGPFELQRDERRLLRDGDEIALRPRTFDLLVVLVERAGVLVTKDELLDRVWRGRIVDEAALRVQLSLLRKVLGSDAIGTVSGQGYRFALPVTPGGGEDKRASSPRHNLPLQLTSFIGREHEITKLEALVTAHRLVTLTGAGGAGKTRLAIELAGRLFDEFPDGVWWVELGTLSDPDLVPHALARALQVKEQPGRSLVEAIGDELASKRLLLVIDNVEHLLDACARLTDEILHRCRDVTVLVTSRERLAMSGELSYRIPSLEVPGPRDDLAPDALLAFEGVRLFIDRARSLRPDLAVGAGNAESLASICRNLDGIPLAIELAAARVCSLSLEEIDSRLGQRFQLLSAGPRTALPRHKTLRSLIDWSYDLLRESEKTFLQRLSVFAGGWTLEAAEAVCAGEGIEREDVLDLLTSLVDKSLVVPEQEDSRMRCRLLETVRQYGRDRLEESGESAAVRERHVNYYLSLAEESESQLKGAEQAEWLQRLEREYENLQASLVGCLTHAAPQSGLRLCGALNRFWWMRGLFTEGRQWCTRFLGMAGAKERTRSRANALNAAGVLSRYQSDYLAAKDFFEEALAIRRELADPSDIAGSLSNLGLIALNQIDYPAARSLFEESLEIRRQLGDRFGIAGTLNNLGLVALYQGELSTARKLFEESVAIRREQGDRFGIALALSNLGNISFEQGDYPIARMLLEETLGIQRELGDRLGVALSLSNLGTVALHQGNYTAAKAMLDESLASGRELGSHCEFIPYSLEALGAVAASTGDPLGGARIWGTAERLRGEMGTPLRERERATHDRHIASARTSCGNDAAFDGAMQEGSRLTLEQAIELFAARPVGQREPD